VNLGQLRVAVDRRTGIAFDPVALLDALNEANRAIAADHDWPWLHATTSFSTVAGTGAYSSAAAIPEDWLRTISLKVADSVPMTRRSPVDLDDAWPSTDSTGRPCEYAIDGSALVLRPVPDSVLTIAHRYVRIEPELVQDSDTPTMPAAFHSTIVEHAAAIVLRRARETARAEECMAAARMWERRMVDDVRRYAGPAKVRVRRRG
jgi:hypothetical protein